MTRHHYDRLRRLRQAIVDRDATAMIVSDAVNVRYLSGFTGSNGALLVGRSPEQDRLATDFRYVTQAGEQCPDLRLVVDRDVAGALVGHLGAGRLGFEPHDLRVSVHQELVRAHPAVVLEPTDHLVEARRTVKDEDELAALAEACRISDVALAALVEEVRVGMTERQIARRLDNLMLEAGAQAVSFETIVAGGPHSAKPHHEPSTRQLEQGDLLLIDFGAAVGGYHADETRTFVVGGAADWQREIHAIVAEAQAAGRDAARADAALLDVDTAARSVVAAAGYGDCFDHGLGHGVGLEIHEAPFFSSRSTGMLPADSPVTIEPGIYLPGRGGVRIEDTLVVGEGPSRSLTASPRDLVVLG